LWVKALIAGMYVKLIDHTVPPTLIRYNIFHWGNIREYILQLDKVRHWAGVSGAFHAAYNLSVGSVKLDKMGQCWCGNDPYSHRKQQNGSDEKHSLCLNIEKPGGPLLLMLYDGEKAILNVLPRLQRGNAFYETINVQPLMVQPSQAMTWRPSLFLFFPMVTEDNNLSNLGVQSIRMEVPRYLHHHNYLWCIECGVIRLVIWWQRLRTYPQQDDKEVRLRCPSISLVSETKSRGKPSTRL